MRISAVIVVVWLIIGAIAAGQRGYFGSSTTNCSKSGNAVLSIIAGPLNYVGVNPKVSCHTPQPSQ
ncbi:MAG TPA: hypothetical protein VGJ07_30170 [Rugosimonospora sp.]|jgi:hypothetical protein